MIRGSEFTTEFTAIQTAFSLAAPVASPTFTGTVTIPTADINGGNIDGTIIGAATPAAGSFTSLTATSTDATITLTGTRGTGDTHTIATAGANSQNLNISADDSIFLRTSDTIQRVGIFAGGDISFYEDTGTTPKFFWDASAESLGIGDSSPDGILDVEGSITIAGSQAGVIFNPSVTPANNNVGSIGLVSGTLNAPASVNASSKISGLRVAPTTSGSFNGAGEVAGVKVETFNGQSATLATGLYVDAPTGGDVNYAAILNGGNVGIGTASPSGNLHVDGGEVFFSSTGDSKLQIKAGNTSSSFIEFGDPDDGNVGRLLYGHSDNSMQFTVNASERMRIDSSGNVGLGNGAYIGTLSSAHSLSIQGGAGAPGGKITLYGGTGSNRIDFLIGASEAARIDSSGNLLVGKTSSSFSVAGVGLMANNQVWATATSDNALALNRLTTDGEIAKFYKDGTAVGSIGASGGTIYAGKGGSGLIFNDGGTKDLIPYSLTAADTVDNSISLGISSKRFKDLYLSGAAIVGAGSSSAPSITASNDTDAGLFWGGGFLGFTGGGSNQMRLDSSGNLLVGTTNPDLILTSGNHGCAIRGALGFIASNRASDSSAAFGRTTTSGSIVEFYYNGVSKGNISTNGTTVSYNTSSDARLKENIADAEDASSLVDAIKVRQFDWKTDGSHQRYGMVAQELLEVAPEAVSGDPESDDMMGVDYSKLVPMLVKEIQSLRARVAQLEGV